MSAAYTRTDLGPLDLSLRVGGSADAGSRDDDEAQLAALRREYENEIRRRAQRVPPGQLAADAR